MSANTHESPPNVVVLGIGNALRTDEGIGSHAIKQLQSLTDLPADIQLLDGGTLGLDLLHYIDNCRALIVIDAIDAGKPAGTVLRMENEQIPAELVQKLSMHQAGLSDLLGILRLRGQEIPHLILVGIQPASFDWGLELSATVAASLDLLVKTIRAEIARLHA